MISMTKKKIRKMLEENAAGINQYKHREKSADFFRKRLKKRCTV